MSDAVIQVKDVGKRYAIGERGYRTLRESLSSLARRGGGDGKPQELWALRDVSFEVERGEVVGVVGLNGAGKTTLLKILSRITFPTTGVSRTRGRVGALLEVGTGFHPELTGRENVFLNAAVLGMTRQETRARLDDIVEFAGLEEFLDTPLKRYSTGMYLRLAFAVAAHVEPDIVIVDEVLAVGDFQFREKCLGRMSDLGREGRTVIFVSHDSGVVHQLCSRALWIDDGTLREDGPTGKVLERYLGSNVQGGSLATFGGSSSRVVDLRSVAIVGAAGEVLDSPRRGEPFSLRVRFATGRPVLGLDVAVSIQTASGVPVLDEVLSDAAAIGEPAKAAGEWEAVFAVPAVLSPGAYLAGVWLGTGAESFVTIREALSFQILPGLGDRPHAAERQRVLTAPSGWHVTSAPADDQP